MDAVDSHAGACAGGVGATAAGFLSWLNPLLAAVSFSIYPAAMLLIPFLQKRASIANKARVDQSRIFSGPGSVKPLFEAGV